MTRKATCITVQFSERNGGCNFKTLVGLVSTVFYKTLSCRKFCLRQKSRDICEIHNSPSDFYVVRCSKSIERSSMKTLKIVTNNGYLLDLRLSIKIH